MGVSINTRNVSFHVRVIIRKIMPIVLMNVLSSTLTLIPTVLPIKLVSLDNLDVISPDRENVKGNDFSPVLFCSVQFCTALLSCPILSYLFLLSSLVLLNPLVHYVMFVLILPSLALCFYIKHPVLTCLILSFTSTEKLFIHHNHMSYSRWLTCLCGLKESNFLFGQSPKQLDFYSACVGTDGAK